MTPKQYEFEVLVNRVLYYCYDSPHIPDADYDKLERWARQYCGTDSPVHGVGSSLRSSYPKDVLDEADRRHNAS